MLTTPARCRWLEDNSETASPDLLLSCVWRFISKNNCIATASICDWATELKPEFHSIVRIVPYCGVQTECTWKCRNSTASPCPFGLHSTLLQNSYSWMKLWRRYMTRYKRQIQLSKGSGDGELNHAQYKSFTGNIVKYLAGSRFNQWRALLDSTLW